MADGDFRMYRDPAGQVWLNAEDTLEVTRSRADIYATKANEADELGDDLVRECYSTACADLRKWADTLDAKIIGAISGM